MISFLRVSAARLILKYISSKSHPEWVERVKIVDFYCVASQFTSHFVSSPTFWIKRSFWKFYVLNFCGITASWEERERWEHDKNQWFLARHISLTCTQVFSGVSRKCQEKVLNFYEREISLTWNTISHAQFDTAVCICTCIITPHPRWEKGNFVRQ